MLIDQQVDRREVVTTDWRRRTGWSRRSSTAPRAWRRACRPAGTDERYTKLLDQAGNPAGWTVERILGLKGAALLVGIVLGAFYGKFQLPNALLFAVIGGAALFFLPDLLIKNVALRRQEQTSKSLADALDMLSVCVEAGQGFDAALLQVARNVDGPISGEFARVLSEIQIGKSRGEAFSLDGRPRHPARGEELHHGPRPGRPARPADRRRAARADRQHAPRPSSEGGGEGAEGHHQDPLPADVLHPAGPLHRHHRPRWHPHDAGLRRLTPAVAFVADTDARVAREAAVQLPGSRGSAGCLPPLVLALLTLKPLGPIKDPDAYWHIVAGEHLVQTGQFVLDDPFGAATEKVWILNQWLPEVLMHWAHTAYGLPGVAWLLCLGPSSSGSRCMPHADAGRPRSSRRSSLAVAFVALSGSLSPRPQLVTFALAAVTTSTWLLTREDGRARWWLVPLTWLWACSHGMWFIGPVIGGVVVVGMLARAAGVRAPAGRLAWCRAVRGRRGS